MSRLARGLVHLGEVLLAAGRDRAVPVDHRRRRRARPDELVQWWDAIDAQRAPTS